MVPALGAGQNLSLAPLVNGALLNDFRTVTPTSGQLVKRNANSSDSQVARVALRPLLADAA